MAKLKNLFLYGGLNRKGYFDIRDNIRENNRAILVAYTIITCIGMTVLLLLSFFFKVLESSRYGYLACTAVSLIMLFIAKGPAKKHTTLTPICVYIFTSLLLIFGIMLGTIVEPNQASASYAILMFAAPLLFTDAPIITDCQLLLSDIVYLIAARLTQSDAMFAFNVSIILPYGIVSLILCVIIMRIKISRQMLDHVNKVLSEKDQLTGMLNRRCYEQELARLRSHEKIHATFYAFDINGLKQVNDTLGHKAGDELICGAADCISNVFGRYGSCYRVGGDEFVAIISGAAPEADALRAELEQRSHAFRGAFVSGLSIAAGMATCDIGADVNKAMQAADAQMYIQKEKYHSIR